MNFQPLLLLVCLTCCFQVSSGLGNKSELETRLELLEEKFLKENGELRAKLHKQQVQFQQQNQKIEEKFLTENGELRAKLHDQQVQLQTQEDKITEQESKLIEIKDRRKRQEYGNEVAFSAGVLANTAPLGPGQVVVFDHVITMVDSTNSPSTYSKITGVFTAPLNGLYVFSTTLTGLHGVDGHYHIYKNDVPETVMWIHGSSGDQYDQESISVILILARGDTVTIRNREAGHALNGEYHGAHSIFSGFLLREHEGQSSVIG